MQTSFHKLESYVIYCLAVLIPVFVLPVFPNAFIIPKLLLLVVAVGILFILRALQVLYYKETKFTFGLFDLSVLLLATAFAASTIFRSPNKMEALLFPGTATAVVAGALLYFFVNNQTEQAKKNLKGFLVLGGLVAAVVSMLASAGILNSLRILPAEVPGQSFSLLNGTMAALVYFLALVPLALGEALSQEDMAKKAFFGVAGFLLVFGIIISALDVFSTKNANVLPGYQSSWGVAVDSLKERPLFGVGPGNYLSAYSRFRPISENLSDLWATRFTQARSFYLHVITETGLLGVASIVFLAISIFGLFRKTSKGGEMTLAEVMLANDTFGALLLLLLVFLFFPAFVGSIVLMFVLMGAATKGKHVTINAGAHEGLHFPPTILAVPFILAVVAVAYFGGRMAIAEAKYNEALSSVRSNDGKASYDKLRDAITINPYVMRYRNTYAQVNLLLTINLAQKTDLTEQEKQTLTQLVQQAIREGKATVALNPERSSSWELLGGIYRTLIPLAKGADNFALQTYNQAVVLDPGNVNARIAIGGIFYQAKNYDSAIRAFELAVVSKPDHANARYNLALAYSAKGEIDKAIAEMERVLQILPQGSADRETAQKQLEDIKAKKPATPSTGQELSPASGQQAPDIEPDLELSQEENPPSAPLVPEATPTAESSATPQPSPAAQP